ncbi:MAG: DNA polymerase III subunit chi [Azoarcus sp.]|jgi:DNA polymerase-3 subunit chi|nr:DNA polymerase III subunit chi [Azoarcus sp.]
MTSVQFYHNAGDPLALACELIGKAHHGGRKAIVINPNAAAAQRLDHQLWTAEPGSFIPHVMNGSPLAAETPIIIGIAGETQWPHTDLLFNLAAEIPSGCERFRMVIEIIGRTEAERQPARMRWMHYKQQQFLLKAFDAEHRIAL